MSGCPTCDASRLAASRITVDTNNRLAAASNGPTNEITLEEPDLDSIVRVLLGKHLWAACHDKPDILAPGAISKPLVPYEDLPFPKSDCAKLSNSTICWQFTGHFNLNKEEGIDQGSLVIQVQHYLELKRAKDRFFLVHFPCGVGHGRFVDIQVHQDTMPILAKAPLVFCGACLQHHLVGLSLPKTAPVIEITGFSPDDINKDFGRNIALLLQLFSIGDNPTLFPNNKVVALVETIASTEGNCDPNRVSAIPGWCYRSSSRIASKVAASWSRKRG
ncbi:related to Retrovirus-related POL polyprotein [Sporisorium scitamineum]|uniref:Related to Retrovirus-related POL polyprotein n=1 Tax=Sporisorium scitamineum TaxID=49012 RepID=A0A0F7RTI3_9BASI|nr:related to Retrovirus-related POL polyprotein [Sporisorium scitamineum]CDS00106.1 hypothetical protein [Sporisorium scitamineum]